MIRNIKTLFLINSCTIVLYNVTVTVEYGKTFQLLDITLFHVLHSTDIKKYPFYSEIFILQIAQQIALPMIQMILE